MVTVSISPEQIRDEALTLFQESIPWIEMLSPTNFQTFLAEFSAATGAAFINADSAVLMQVLEKWEKAAEIDGTGSLLPQ